MENSFRPFLNGVPTTLSTLTIGESSSSVRDFREIKLVAQISPLTRAIAYQGLFTVK